MRKLMLCGAAALVVAAGAGLSSCATTGGQSASAETVRLDAPTIIATRRVNESQYRATIADIFGSDIELNGRFEPDQRAHGLLAVGSAKLSITGGGFEQYYAMGRAVSEQSLNATRRSKFVTCELAAGQVTNDACTAEFIKKYGRMLFRRPLTDAEVASRVAVANRGAQQGNDYYAGLKLALTSLLTAPEFLFRVEVAEPDPDNARRSRLDGYTKAARLSYLMWNTTPDAELLAAAEDGSIHDDAVLQAQVRRLSSSPRLESGVRALFTDMMQMEKFETVTKDAATYPKYSSTVANSARVQTLKTLVDHLLVKRGDYREIFTTPHTFIDRPLASVYQLPFMATSGWSPYTYPDTADQAGVLTQVTFLSLFSHPGTSSPTLRGVALNEIFLCEETPLPPANVDFSVVQDTTNPLLKTVRARLLAHATEETCAGCHNLTDPIGLSLERFDSIGQRRDTENGEPIDVSSELDGHAFTGAKGLGQVLRENPRVPACLVQNVYAYGVGRAPEAPWETAFLEAQTAAFASAGYVVPDMMARIALTPEFYRVVLAPEPEAPAEEPATVAQTSSSRGRS